MIDIDWNVFRANNKNYRSSFEDLCYHLFCRSHGISEGIRADFNHAGLETDPVSTNIGWVGFQSKFFDTSIDYDQIKSSVEKALRIYAGNLSSIWVYTNLAPSARAKGPKTLASLAKKSNVTIEWIVPSNFKSILAKPCNLDLAALYFGGGDVLGFIKNSTRPSFQTLIGSAHFLNLKFKRSSHVVTDLKGEFLNHAGKVSLLVGSPGAGKSMCVHKLFRELAGLETASKAKMAGALAASNGVPIIVDLKNCNSSSLESILGHRKGECSFGGKSYNYIYLLDGLDELTEIHADQVLAFAKELSERSSTQKIMLSCRSGNGNRFRVKTYFSDVLEFSIDDISESEVTSYFKACLAPDDFAKIEKLATTNRSLIKEIKDVLFVRLLWDTIDDLDGESTLLDLLELKITHLLESPTHKKSLLSLNLPQPKAEAVNKINQRISSHFQKSYQFRFPLMDLQDLVLKLYPRLTYKDVDEIVSYVATVFFDHVEKTGLRQRDFIYQHRRYQEFFYVSYLKQKYETNPAELRKSGLLASKDLFRGLFLGFLRRSYEKSRDICGISEVNFIDSYLGNNKWFSSDEGCYRESELFPVALATLKEEIFAELIYDPQVEVKDKVLINVGELKATIESWKNDPSEYFAGQRLFEFWETDVSRSIRMCACLWKGRKEDAARDILKNIRTVSKLLQESFLKSKDAKQRNPKDPFWSSWDDWLFVRVEMSGLDVVDCLNEVVRSNYQNVGDERSLPSEPSGKEKLLAALFKVCLSRPEKHLSRLIPELTFDEFEVLLATAVTVEFLPILVSNPGLKERGLELMGSNHEVSPQRLLKLIFVKRVFGIQLNEEDLKHVESEFKRIRDTRSFDWNFHGLELLFGISCFILDRQSFDELIGSQFSYYSDSSLYAALFQTYLNVLSRRSNLDQVSSNFLRYMAHAKDRTERFLGKKISQLMGRVISAGFSDGSNVQLARKMVFDDNFSSTAAECLLVVHQENPFAFKKLVSRSDLDLLVASTESSEDAFSVVVDRYFLAAILFDDVDSLASKSLLQRGIFEGMLRHGWRKDGIVSVDLVDSFEVLVSRNFLDPEEIRNLAHKMLKITVRVTNITDGKGTWHGPYSLIGVVARCDLGLAIELVDKLKKMGDREIDNRANTSILMARVSNGEKFSEIEAGFKDYRNKYYHDGKPQSEVFEAKWRVLITVAQSSLYSTSERESAFKKASDLVDEVLKLNISMAFRDGVLKSEKIEFRELCTKYGKEFRLTFDEKDEDDRTPKMPEREWVEKLLEADSQTKIEALFSLILEHQNRIVVSAEQHWRAIAKHVVEVCGNAKPCLDLLRANHFPNTNFYSSNSRSLHYLLAELLAAPSTKAEVFDYLKTQSGRGFVSLISAYAANDDKSMCLRLFERFFGLCDLLVY